MDTHITDNPIIRARLSAARSAMAEANVEALLVPSSDPHLSEYLPERWKAREWFSGFTGSMGTLVITMNDALLFADSRYWQQAEVELAGTGITLFRIKSGASTEHIDWLANHVAAGKTVAVDGAVIGLASYRLLNASLAVHDVVLRADIDVLNDAWQDRPTLPTAAIYLHTPPHAVTSRVDKITATREAMNAAGAAWHILSTLDDIAYLLNLRGSDVNFNPVFVAHAIVGVADVTLFVMPNKLPDALIAEIARDGVSVKDYDQFHTALHNINGGTLMLDPRRITHRTREAIATTVKTIETVNPTTFAKSKKTAIEADHVRHTMAQDAAAMAEFYAWFESALGREKITEVTIDEKLTEARAKREGFVSRSFATIAGFKANGALNHYRAVPATAATIEGDGILLIDSGGQYLGGTTDITRVWPIGKFTHEQQRDYTLVLKGMMALSNAKFPRGVKSPYLDAIARAPIWAAGFDYGHGTGHGVGYFMNVHEGPQTISQGAPDPHTAMEAGMITSIEPGLYRDGQWGMRIENLVLNVPAGNNGFGDFLQFETLTLCPIDTRLIDTSLLREDEIAWLNAYHAEVARRVLPHVSGAAREWLVARTKAI
jgi:Xaa-Pro aminopeptidase